MNLRTSYFNLSLFKSNLKRFCWIGIAVLVAFLTVALLYLFNEDSVDGFCIMSTVAIGVAGILPAILFSYLNSSGAVTCLHALPIKRKAHFITNIATIFVLILVPAIIAYAIGFIYCLSELPTGIKDLIDYFIALIMCITIASSAGTLASMITGNTIAAIAFTIILFAFPFYSEWIVKSFLSVNVYGMWDVEYYILGNFSLMEPNTIMTVLFAVGVVEFVASWFLYKYRKLETNGDIISFNFLKPVFIAGVSLFSGLIGYFYLGIFFKNSIFLMLPFGILGAVVSYMLSKKAFTIKGIWKPVLIYVLFVGVCYATITYDLTGFERRIPDLGDIASIDMVNMEEINGRNDYYIVDGKRYYEPKSVEDYRYYDEKDFKNIINLHAYNVENRNSRYDKIYIVYNLKNGKTLKRVYHMSVIEDRKYLEPIFCTEQKQKLNHDWLVNEPPVIDITISDSRMKNDSKIFEVLAGDSDKAKLLLDALKKDVKEANYEDIVSFSNSMTQVQLSYKSIMKDEKGNDVIGLTNNSSYDTFGIPKSYKRTTALLNEWGLFDAICKPEDIAYVELEFNFNENAVVKIDDANAIKEIYDYVSDSKYIYSGKNYYNIIYNIRATFYNSDGRDVLDSYELQTSIMPLPELIDTEAKRFALKYGAGYDNDPNIIEREVESF